MTHDLPRNDADNGEPVVPADQRNWGPGGRPEHPELVVRWTPSTSLGWRAYHESMCPPGGLVTLWIRFKVMSTGVNVARRLWDQREELRAAYEAEHGSDPENWPHRHPGIVIDAVQFVAHTACLGCQWIDQPGSSMEETGWREAAAAVARRHERSHGEFRGQPDQ
jgi:hypothetical protein